MKKLIATSALALLVGMGTALADEVKIKQNFDLDRIDQKVTNKLEATRSVTGSKLDGTNIQNVLQWRDVSPDMGADYGDIYQFDQYTDEEQRILNEVSSKYGAVGAELSATNLQNVLNLEDKLGGSEEVGDHILIDQKLEDTLQTATNRITADNEVLSGSKAEITNLANVASVVDQYGGGEYGNIVRLDQMARDSVQKAENVVRSGGVGGITMSALNGVNIASFDLKDQSGKADIELDQKTRDITQTISNRIDASGAVANATLSGTNLGNVISFAAAATN
ncbi:hypothetical protein [Benzoatithermus flavus]|uniref:Flagellin n=1 Tax=Benzoatithermus flavus TaxID=3108223 RepID=A0ABU8XSF6_9PROT